eukprot:2479768-Karenia_brevis.AAC.1
MMMMMMLMMKMLTMLSMMIMALSTNSRSTAPADVVVLHDVLNLYNVYFSDMLPMLSMLKPDFSWH